MSRELFLIAEQTARAQGVDSIEILVHSETSALTRFANNAIGQNVSESAHFVSVRALIDGRTARASTNRTDADSIRSVTEQAIALTRASEPDETLPSLAEPAPITPVTRYFDRTAEATPQDRARAVAEAIRIIEAEGQTAAGIYQTEYSHELLMNSRGVFAEHRETMARFSITAMAADSSGWAKATAPNLADIDTSALARSASLKAKLSATPQELPPGAYTVILEPAAVLDLVGQIFADFGATAVHEQRSFLTDRLNEPLFGDNITIYDDVFHPLQSGTPFDGEGVPRQKLTLVKNGTPTALAVSRSSAKRDGIPATGHGFSLPCEDRESPANIVIAGGNALIDDMIRSTGRGILVTRLWYIREVDPFEKIMTGMTRDGTFLIEDGQLKTGLVNFRFNQSVIEMLRNVVLLGPSVRSTGEEAFDMVVPAMKVDGFNFTEVTKF